jgi:hypothetical protein
MLSSFRSIIRHRTNSFGAAASFSISLARRNKLPSDDYQKLIGAMNEEVKKREAEAEVEVKPQGFSFTSMSCREYDRFSWH